MARGSEFSRGQPGPDTLKGFLIFVTFGGEAAGPPLERGRVLCYWRLLTQHMESLTQHMDYSQTTSAAWPTDSRPAPSELECGQVTQQESSVD